MLVVLESLSPLERAVFVLREAFGYPYAEIATILDRSQAAVRQLAGRARRHVQERKPRFEVDPAKQRDLTERFLRAAGGDLDGLLSCWRRTPGCGDSGGKAKAPLRTIESADKVARFFFGISAASSRRGRPWCSRRSTAVRRWCCTARPVRSRRRWSISTRTPG